MATTSQQRSDADISRILDSEMPGDTVSALLAEGKEEEARDELERLLLEGIASGPDLEATAQFWADLKAEVTAATKR